MENTNTVVNENVNAAVENDEPIRVMVEEKEGFGAKLKNGINKAIHSTPGKIIGGVGLVAVGFVGAMLCGLLKSDDTDDDEVVADVDYSELVDTGDESEVNEVVED